MEKTYLNLKYYIQIFVKLCLLLSLLEIWHVQWLVMNLNTTKDGIHLWWLEPWNKVIFLSLSFMLHIN
jgi:succinate dehydrogenase hydrophobic anchor subunit